jgi:hypothetical protein
MVNFRDPSVETRDARAYGFTATVSLEFESILNWGFFFGSYTLEVLAPYEWVVYVGLGTSLLL